MRKKQSLHYTFQGQNLGAEYIHNNWLYFGNTAKIYEDKIDEVISGLRDIIIGYLDKEVAFYEAAQAEYVRLVSANFKAQGDNISSPEAILKHFRTVYKNNLQDKSTNFGKLEFSKDSLALDGTWLFMSKKDTDIVLQSKTKKGVGNKKSREKAQQEIPVIIDGITNFLENLTGDANLKFLETSKYGQTTETSKVVALLRNDELKTKLKNELERIRKKAMAMTIKQKDIARLNQIITSVLNLHSKMGLLAETFIVELINTSIPSLVVGMTDKKAQPVGNISKNFNIIDGGLGKITLAGKEVTVGLSQKFQNTADFAVTYKTNDIFDSLENYVSSIEGSDGKQKVLIEKSQQIFDYMRKNIIALETWSLDKKSYSPFDTDKFKEKEAELALLRGFLRFFNGWMTMDEKGEFSPFESKSKLENPLIFNAFLVLRQDIYWMIDFIRVARDLVVSAKGPSVSATGFSAKPLYKASSLSKSSVTQLWNAKKERMKELTKENKGITYEALENGKEVAEAIRDLSSRLSGRNKFLVEEISYYLNAETILKK